MDNTNCATQLIEVGTACGRALRGGVSRLRSAGMWLVAPSSVAFAAVAVPTTAKYFHRQINVPAARGGPS